MSKPLEQGAYDVSVQRKEPKGAPVLIEPEGFTVRPPEIVSIDPPGGFAGQQVTIEVLFFGSKKGKVFLEYESKGERKWKSCKILKWEMGSKTGESKAVFVVPPGLPSGPHPLKIVNALGEASASFAILSSP